MTREQRGSLERAVLLFLLGLLAGLATPAWTFGQRMAALETSMKSITAAVTRVEDRLDRYPPKSH